MAVELTIETPVAPESTDRIIALRSSGTTPEEKTVVINFADFRALLSEYSPLTPYDVADGFGTTQEANTNALQLALDECVGPVSTPHGTAGRFSNKVLFIPQGNFTCGPLSVKHVHGFVMYGAGMDVTRLYNPDSDDYLFGTNGFARCEVSNMTFERGSVGTSFDLSWDNSAGGNALQSNKFYNCAFNGGEFGFKVAYGGHMGSENAWNDCWFSNTGVGLSIAGANALQNAIRGGNIAGCATGIHVITGSAPIIENIGFQLNSQQDIYIQLAPSSDGYLISGCRSESRNFIRIGEGHVKLVGITHTGNSITPGVFAQIDGGTVEIEACGSNYGQIQAANSTQIQIKDGNFGRTDFLKTTTLWATPINVLPGRVTLENVVFGYGDSDPVAFKYIEYQKYSGGFIADGSGFDVVRIETREEKTATRVTSAFAKTDATLATVTELTAKLQGGKLYRFKVHLFVTADATGGYKVALSGTATATSIIYQIKAIDNGTNALTITSRKTALDQAASAATGTSVLIEIDGEIDVDDAGTLLVQFAQSTANGTSSVLVGSTFTTTREDPVVPTNIPGYLYKAGGSALPLVYYDLQNQRFWYNVLAHGTFAEWLTAASGAANLVQSSEDIAGADSNTDWTQADVSVSGQTFTEDTANAPHAVYTVITAPDVTATATFQCKLKAGTRSYAYVGIQGPEGDGATVIVDLAHGLLGETNVGANSGEILDSSLTSLGSGVYLVTLTATMRTSGGIIVPKIGMATAASGNTFDAACNPTFLGSSKTILAYAPQFEFGEVASTYIPTKSSAVAVRDASNTAIVSGLMIEGSAVEIAAATEQVFWQRDDGTESNRIRFVRKTDTHLYLIVTVASVAQCSLDLGAVVDGEEFKAAFRAGANDFSGCLDGGSVVTDTSGTMPTITRERFGADTTTGDQWQSESALREIWTVALSDAELQALTT